MHGFQKHYRSQTLTYLRSLRHSSFFCSDIPEQTTALRGDSTQICIIRAAAATSRRTATMNYSEVHFKLKWAQNWLTKKYIWQEVTKIIYLTFFWYRLGSIFTRPSPVFVFTASHIESN
jgi:hypothetical protein